MIISQALREVFKGLQIEVKNGTEVVNRDVQFHYGDQKELLLWVKQRGNLEKYPLIWYVLNDYNDVNGTFITDARIVLMQVTKVDVMNVWRSENTYKNVLQPLSRLVKEKLLAHSYVNIVGDNPDKIIERDEPKYGLRRKNDETSGASESIVTDIVDARILRFKMHIKPDCIIK